MTDTLTFPPQAFTHLLKHGTATTIGVMEPQPERIVVYSGEKFRWDGHDDGLWRYENEFLAYINDHAPHREGETVSIVDYGKGTNDKNTPYYEATVVSVTVKLVRELIKAEWSATGLSTWLWIGHWIPHAVASWRTLHVGHPFDTTYVWVTEWSKI